jgi:hypothetical protein
VTDVLFRPWTGSRLLPFLVALICCAADLRAQSSPQSTSPDERSKALKELPPPRQLTPVVTYNLAEVPEVEFQTAPARGANPQQSADRIARLIVGISELDRKDADGFIKALRGERADFAGLPFLLGGACRTTGDRHKAFHRAVLDERRGNGMRRDAEEAEIPARIAALMQMLAAEPPGVRLALIDYLAALSHPEATRALARLAVYDPQRPVHEAAVKALKARPPRDYLDVLSAGLRYPWGAVAENAADAVVALKRTELIPLLVDLLDEPDPRAPLPKTGARDTYVVREVVKVNHLRGCLLCHAPADDDGKDPDVLKSPIPMPGERYTREPYSRPRARILVRVDVTYLRQDFSMLLPVENADPWPALQRYDFLVRERTLTAAEAEACREALRQGTPGLQGPHRLAYLQALRDLTERDAGFASADWRKMLDLPAKEAPANGTALGSSR